MSSKMRSVLGTPSNMNCKRRISLELSNNISPKKISSQEYMEKFNASFPNCSNESSDTRSFILSKKSKSTPRKRKPRLDEESLQDISKRKISYNMPMVPKYRDYQLLGDSQLVRFAEQILEEQVSLTEETHSRYIGFCVSGQRINDLRAQLAKYDYNVHPNVIMMIGTNDLIQRTDLQWMCSKYSDMLSNLLTKCERIVLLTIPPIPKVQALDQHWFLLERFNKFILAQEDRKKVFVIDFGTLFISYNNTAILDYFEKTFRPGERPDLIHLNLRGFKILKAALDTLYFAEQNIL